MVGWGVVGVGGVVGVVRQGCVVGVARDSRVKAKSAWRLKCYGYP